MKARPDFAIVGAFMLGLTAVAIAVGLWLASGGASLQRHDHYIARFEESVSGLSRGAPVKYRGVSVGTVRETALDAADPDRVRVVLEVARGTPITQDTVAVLVFQGLTGIATVDLAGGGRGSPPLLPTRGEPYPVIRTAPSMMRRLEVGVTALLADLGETARSANALLDDETRVALHRTVADLQQLVHTVAGRSSDVEAGISDAAESLRHAAEASARLPGLVARIGRGADAVETGCGRVVQREQPCTTGFRPGPGPHPGALRTARRLKAARARAPDRPRRRGEVVGSQERPARLPADSPDRRAGPYIVRDRTRLGCAAARRRGASPAC